MPIKHRRIVKMFVQDDCSEAVWAAFDEAKRKVEFPIAFEQQLVNESKRGAPWECVLSRGIAAEAKRHPSLFDHPVRGAYVIGTALYIVTRRAKNFDDNHRAVRYRHNFTKHLRKFDTLTKAQFIELFGDEGVTIRLAPIRKSQISQHEREARTKDVGRPESKPKKMTGAFRRAKDAGLLTPGTPPAG